MRIRPAHARARSTSSLRARKLAGTLLVAVLLGTGVWLGPELASSRKAATAPPGSSSDPTVAVVGDSITALSRQSIASSLVQAGYQSTIDAVVGIEIGQAEPLVDQLAAHGPSDWVIELGTNDAGLNNPNWALPLLAEWHQVQSSRCVIYLTVSQRAGPIAAQIDDSLTALARTHANVHVLDWGFLEYANPAWVEPDMIHPTPAGQTELAVLETQAIRRYC